MRNSGLLVLFFFFFFVQGCATFDGLLVRRTDASEFLSKIEERTAAVLASDEKFTLDRCLRIALDNNLDMKTADLEKRVATLNRRIAFANFLPKITFDYKSTELNNAPATALFGSISTPMQDRIVRDTAVQAQMPIFAPSTWFLYALHQRGEEISEAAAAYTRQMIALQVTGLYFQCLATEESRRMLEAQHAAASELMKEAAAYYGEGMVTDADIAQVRVLLLVREKALEFNARARERCLAELLTVMGLAPTASIELEVSTPLEDIEGTLEDWVGETLLHHPRLAIADRLVAIEKEKVRIAIAAFLPSLAGFAGRSHSSNSYMTYPYISAVGFAGLMTVFNGFATVNDYKVARSEQKKAFLNREQESLALMLEVVRAYTNVADAQVNMELAQAVASAMDLRLKEETAKMREGLLRPSEILDTTAQHNEAQVNVNNAYYQKQVMTAIARNVLGITYQGKEEDRNE